MCDVAIVCCSRSCLSRSRVMVVVVVELQEEVVVVEFDVERCYRCRGRWWGDWRTVG